MTIKEKMLVMLKEAQTEEKNLRAAVIDGETKEERASAQEALDKVIEKITEINDIIAELDEPADEPANETPTEENKDNNKGDERKMNILDTMETRTAEKKIADRFDTNEYRSAFMNFCKNGTPIPAELRATTTTTDASAVIPTTLMHEIVKGLASYGNLYAAVRHLNVQGGVEIPVLSLKPTATWITANTSTSESEDQKLLANTSIMFSYFGLECKIAQTLLANVTTIEAFQALFVPLATEAMAKALDAAIIKGTGSGMPLGVTVDTRVPAKNVITLTAEEFTSYSAWKKKVFGKMKKSYRNGTFYMAQGTFDGYIDGMVDSVGQPVGRVNYGIDGAENYRFCGKNVETVEDDVITSYDDASAGDVVAVFFKASDYGVNSNMEMKTVKWTDNETNEVKMKTILICDGKLIDANGVIIVKKGA
jgi:HK97 family phage major capsid protein